MTQSDIKLLSDNLFLLPILFSRFMATFLSLSFLRREFVPLKFSLFLSLVLSLFILSYGLLNLESRNAFLRQSYFVLAEEVFLGLITGVIISLFFDIFIGLGQIISVQGGLSFVTLYLPKMGSISALSNFFFISSILIFLQLNGHLIVLKMLFDSYQRPPLLSHGWNADMLKEVLIFAKIIFSASLMLALAILVSLLISNITIAVMTKFSPQMNIFSIGINISLIICFFFAYLFFDAILEHGRILLNEIFSVCRQRIFHI